MYDSKIILMDPENRLPNSINSETGFVIVILRENLTVPISIEFDRLGNAITASLSTLDKRLQDTLAAWHCLASGNARTWNYQRPFGTKSIANSIPVTSCFKSKT